MSGHRRTVGMTSDKISTTPGPRPLRVPVGAEAGLTGHGESYVDTANSFTASEPERRRRAATAGWLAPAELTAVELGHG